MCGRFTLTSTDGLVDEFELEAAPLELAPRFNIAPTQPVAVIPNRDGPRRVALLKWGLVPSWAKDPAIGNRLINARVETVAERPSFCDALARRRCLVVADGFYEWKRDGNRSRPHWFRRHAKRPFAFAGLWERWRRPDGTWLCSCTIITTEASDVVRPVHHRMPVILDRARYALWLEPGQVPVPILEEALQAPGPDDLVPCEVSPRVGSPSAEGPACIEPIGTQSSLFRE